MSRRRSSGGRPLFLLLLLALVAAAAIYLRCGEGFGLGGGGGGGGRGDQVDVDHPTDPDRDSDDTDLGEVRGVMGGRCQLRLDANGLSLAGSPVTVDKAVKTCKAAGGAELTATGDAIFGELERIGAALEQAGVPVFRRDVGGSSPPTAGPPEPGAEPPAPEPPTETR